MKQLNKPEFPLEHFKLQLKFAEIASHVAGLPLPQALLEYTQYWKRIGNSGWSFDRSSELWSQFCARVEAGERPDSVAFDFYSGNQPVANGPEKRRFGCFRYDYREKHAGGERHSIVIHFRNCDQSGFGPLSKERMSARAGELSEMFSHIARSHPQAQIVLGGSWLYNLGSYKRLFPIEFTKNPRVEEVPFPRSAGIWGQFLNSEGEVKTDVAEEFLLKARQATNITELLQSFKFRILFPKCRIEEFYSLYRVETAHFPSFAPSPAAQLEP